MNRPAGSQRNLLGEGSDFEVGPHGLNAFCDYDLRGVFDLPGVQPVFDETLRHDGRFSLRLTAADPHLEKREARFGRGWVKDKINYVNAVEFAPVKLDPATTYTLSAWLRSDTDDMVAFMSCWEPSDYYSNGAFCRTLLLPVSKEWKRYSYTFKADTFKVLNYRQARIGIGSDVVKGSLWIDDVQLEQGATASDYLAAPLEFGVAIGQPCKLFTVEELGNALMTARFRNNSATVATLKVNYKITDYWDTPVASGDIQATLAANGNATIPVKLPALPCGYYRAFFASADGRLRDEAIFGVYQPVANGAATSWLGCHYSPTVAAGATPLHRQLGFGWVRLFTRFSFNQVCPAEGKFDFSETDLIVERCKKAQLKVMPILGDAFYYTDNQMLNPIPAWAVERKAKSSVKDSWAKEGVVFPRLAAWKAYVKAVVSRYKGDIKAWEIMNEPNCWVTAEEYAPYLEAAYDAAKEADPDCMIVGGGATSDWGGESGCLDNPAFGHRPRPASGRPFHPLVWEYAPGTDRNPRDGQDPGRA